MERRHSSLLIIACAVWFPGSFCLALIPPPHSKARRQGKSVQILYTQTLYNPASRIDGHLYLNDPATKSNNDVPRGGFTYSPSNILSSVKLGYIQRVAADPSFLSKSILEVILAAATQYAAEVSRRGRHRILPEVDFVTAGILTAVCGKYYSMWRVAKTVGGDYDVNNMTSDSNIRQKSKWRDAIPTNAFQPTLLDGHTKPSLTSRLLAILLPMPELFRAGVIASTIGYGLTSILVQLRTAIVPNYIAATVPVSVVGAAIYTGVFMAIVSNIRYQLLQGVVEPYLIEEPLRKMEAWCDSSKTKNKQHVGKIRWNGGWKKLQALIIVIVRWANGLLGSWIAIGGMRACGLQKLKS